ncbi:MAG: neutral/alkaline non-lysosomal ceramidase N-terminal domain-containing protein [Verrucomicrobiae bacterium]|nr:neutral/alkaline non-lysosomal ceramidase N-terminal domain-containing protein [Verrucomicrobiae bacterium]
MSRIKITPEVPLPMSGYASRTDPFTSVKQDIWAKALVLEDETGHRVAIITTDLVGIYADISPAIYAGITEKTGIKREDVLLTWSHTHSAPRLTLESGTSKISRDAVAYTKKFQNQVIHIVDVATRSLQPVDLNWGTGFIPFVMNRRQRTPTGIRLNPNPSGHVDRSMPCMKISTTSGELMAVLFQVACHNTTLGGDNYALCGDYSGFAQKEIEDLYPGANAMFMTGCAGNANPYPRGTMEIAEEHGHTVAMEVSRMLEGEELSKIEGPVTTALGMAHLPLQPAKPLDELRDIAAKGPNWKKGNASKMLQILESGAKLPTHYDAPVAVWQFGKDLTLVSLSGEVVSGYVLETQKAIGHQKLWVSAYAHDYFGYFPTAQIVRDGGYESRGLFNGTGWFDEKAEAAMVDTITKLAHQAGRKFE